MLTALGYKPGSTDDGTWHEGLSKAYGAFLSDVGLPTSRVLTPQGLRRLREVARSEGAAGADAAAKAVSASAPERLHGAVIAGDIEGVHELLSDGARVDGRDSQGWTPLMHAANKGYVLLVDILLRSGASPDIRAADGATALFMATMNAHPEAIALLMRAGASVSIRGPRGLTAVDVARLVYGEKKEQRPVPADAEVHALLGGMTWAEAVKETVAGPKAKRRADPSASQQQQKAKLQNTGREAPSAAPSARSAKAAEAAMALTRTQRVSVQKALSALGFDVGSADGLFGHRTRTAIAAFQRAGSLLETGYLTQDQFGELVTKGEEAAKHQADDAAFLRAKTTGTMDSYRLYLEAFPSGRHADEARQFADEAEKAARDEAKRKAEAHRLKEGCPNVTGEFLYVDSHSYKRYLNIGWKLTPDSTTYEFRRHDLLTSHNNPPPYVVRIGSSSVLRYEDQYASDLMIEIVLHGKCENEKLLVERKHNYDTPGWFINHPFTVWATYQLVGEKLSVSERQKMHPNDGGKTYDSTIMYRRISYTAGSDTEKPKTELRSTNRRRPAHCDDNKNMRDAITGTMAETITGLARGRDDGIGGLFGGVFGGVVGSMNEADDQECR
ncbi:MAG: ankyrin repeat domain-containing protein [Rhodospirillaceae bacterium]|nr:ankyrin repeat domain-containing protein [Rhodospirillaceae bacterium]